MEIRVQPDTETHQRHEAGNQTAQPLTAYASIVALVLLAVVTFAGRAVNLDEPQYLHVAASAAFHDWLFPQSASWTFFGVPYPNMTSQTHLPVGEYYLAMLFKLVGRFSAVRFRLLFAVFPLMSAICFYRLARRFTSDPLWAVLIFVASPAFFVMGSTLMMDLPMLAFLLAGLSCYFNNPERPRRLWFVAIFFILAAGAGYTTLVPIACLLAWAVVNRRPKIEWIALTAAPAVILVWLGVLAWRFGIWPGSLLASYYTSHSWRAAVVAPLFSFLGGVAFFPWVHLLLPDTRARRARLVLASLLAASFLTLFYGWPSLAYRLWYVFLAAAGISVLALFAWKSLSEWKSGPAGYGFLVIWPTCSLLFLLAFGEMMSARYLLLVIAPLMLVLFDRVRRREAVCIFVASLSLSLALTIGDYRFAGLYPRAVVNEILPLKDQGFRVWSATEAGLRFYLEADGVETLGSKDLRPRGGDFIVRDDAFRYALSRELEPLLLHVHRIALQDVYPIRTMSRAAHAGFHDSDLGVVPFAVSRAPLDEIEIDEVSPFVTTLPEAPPPDFSGVPVWFPGGVLLKQVAPEMSFNLKIPADAQIDYRLEGRGSVTRSGNQLILTKDDVKPILWENFRIVPGIWSR
jgi:4-amino-4-deoxy-L-arabinose transferase-like glycosyltransferase